MGLKVRFYIAFSWFFRIWFSMLGFVVFKGRKEVALGSLVYFG